MLKKVLVSVSLQELCLFRSLEWQGHIPPTISRASPGNIGGESPGSVISGAAKAPGLSTPEAFGGSPPGQSVKQVTPGHAPPPPDEDPTPPADEDPTPPADEVPAPPAPPEQPAPPPPPEQPAPPPPPEQPAPPPEPAPVT
jgi:hypothetical protein